MKQIQNFCMHFFKNPAPLLPVPKLSVFHRFREIQTPQTIVKRIAGANTFESFKRLLFRGNFYISFRCHRGRDRFFQFWVLL